MWGEARRFVVVGITVTILHYAVYWLLMHYMEASVAFTIGYFVSFLANYYLSARYTFHKKKSLNNGIGFIAAHAFNYVLQVSLLKLMLCIGRCARLLHFLPKRHRRACQLRVGAYRIPQARPKRLTKI